MKTNSLMIVFLVFFTIHVEGDFQCKDNEKTVLSTDVCDGGPHCQDLSDEWEHTCPNCTGIYCPYHGVSVCLPDTHLFSIRAISI